MSLLGDDGFGYELARKLESCGVWRAWLGDSLYPTFSRYLSSPNSWEFFLGVDDNKSKPQIQLQLRVRALLFDKASVSLFLRNSPNISNSSSSTSFLVSKLSSNYLQLHGDDVYFTLENNAEDEQREGGVVSDRSSFKNQAKPTISNRPRYSESEFDNLSQRFRNDELPETWYNQFIEKYRVNRPYMLSNGDRDSDKRTPEDMSAYVRVLAKHKRKRVAFQEDQSTTSGNSLMENRSSMPQSSILDGNISDEDIPFFPETMFTRNCVPESSLLSITRSDESQKVELYGVLDTLPQVMTRNPVMIERLGIMPEYLSMEHRGGLRRERRDKRCLSEEQALQLSKKVIARMLNNVGFEGASEVPVEILSQLFSHHISKLGGILKVLADSYKKQCSAVELLKMFLQTTGYSNFGSLVEIVKDGTRSLAQQSQQQAQQLVQQQTQQQAQQQAHALQSQFLSQQQSTLRLPQQISRQTHLQMPQMVHPQNLTFQQQQQLERTRRRQSPTIRSGMDMDKDRPMVQVKLENPSELPIDGNTFNPLNARYQQMQFRQQQQQQQQQQLASLHAQSNSQYRQLAAMQIPQMHSPNMGIVRAPPVKVEGFQELMGGDSSLKHDSEENKLMSPSGK